jgi:GTP-binding protein
VKFLDSAKIYIKAGNGGRGSVSFRREKFIEFGGPNGGTGGHGADVYFEATESLNTLIDFRYKQHFMAQNGAGGQGKNKSGEQGKDLIIKVPVGTVIMNEDKTEVLFDLTTNGERVLFLEGGMGGRGNASFKSSTNRAPRFAQPGIAGEEIWVWLELEVIADVGLIGLPNAGKSSLITSITNSKSKVANYAFTTLKPHLGVLDIYDNQIIIADLPGLIDGASDGLGLGTQFLSHIKRCKCFLHMIDVSQDDVVTAYQIVINELKEFNADLLEKEEIIVLNKTDLIDSATLEEIKAELRKVTTSKIFHISVLNMEGLDVLSKALYELYQSFKPQIIESSTWSPI